jgi:tetrachlorobenzoquinone reductase
MNGGAPNRLQVRLRAIEFGACNINIYKFARIDGRPLPAPAPGAHILLEISDGIKRSYSLILPSASPDEYAVAVLALADGRGGSRAWHHDSLVGSCYWISEPQNNFALSDSQANAMLFAGGIGITPVIGMYRALVKRGVLTKLFYWVKRADDILFTGELLDDPNVCIYRSSDHGRPRIADIIEPLPSDTQLYCCGPHRMLQDFEKATTSRARHLVHSERFVGEGGGVRPESFVVRLGRQGTSLEVKPGQSILQACLDAGIAVSYSCEEGICGACEVKVLAGAVNHRDSFRSAVEHDALQTMMICCSLAATEELVLDI